MNEWDLQKLLSTFWRQNDLKLQSDCFELVCWELMFPSWLINDNRRKWNEISIDFIFYSQSSETFICAELKNRIKTRKELLSAYCQTIQRSVKFTNQYSPEKMNIVMRECYKYASQERGGKILNRETVEFSDKPNIKMKLLAYKYPAKVNDYLTVWNEMNYQEIVNEIEQYSENKEFKRFKEIDLNEFLNLKSRKVEKLNVNYTQQKLKRRYPLTNSGFNAV